MPTPALGDVPKCQARLEYLIQRSQPGRRARLRRHPPPWRHGYSIGQLIGLARALDPGLTAEDFADAGSRLDHLAWPGW
jgi:hypothetical protein